MQNGPGNNNTEHGANGANTSCALEDVVALKFIINNGHLAGPMVIAVGSCPHCIAVRLTLPSFCGRQIWKATWSLHMMSSPHL